MKNPNSIFKSWVPEKYIAPILIVALFPHLMLLTIFNMNSTFTASFLDLEVDDLQFLFSMAYALIVCSLFIHTRLFQRINVRSYLLLMTILNILVLYGMSLTTNTQVLLVLRILQAPISMFEGCILLPIIISSIKHENAKFIAFSCLYAIMMTGDKFTTSIIKFAIENYTHNMIVYTIILFHIFVLVLYALIFNQNRLFPKRPLYQTSLGGILLMVISLVSGAYFFIYGKKLYWFQSTNITIAFSLCLLFSGLFIYHQKTSKRPLFHFEIFRSDRVIIGLILFFFLYIMKSSMSNVYQVMAQVWKYPWTYVLNLQYYNVLGSFLGVFFSYFMLSKKVDFKIIFTIGFTLLSGCMLYFSTIFTPDTRVQMVIPGLFLQGFSQGILFTPIAMYMLGSVHPSISGSAAQSGTAIRFWTSTIGYSLMQNVMLHFTTKHQFFMNENLDVTNPIFQQEWNQLYNKFDSSYLANDTISLTMSSIKAKLYSQALLVSSIEIFYYLFIIGALVVCGIIFYRPLRKIIY